MLTTSKTEKRVDPRVRRTRKLISQAFAGLIAEKGFQSITVQDVADRAEVNRATFYDHFEDKYDLLDSFVREGFVAWLAKNNPAANELCLTQLARLVEAVFEYFAEINGHCDPATERQVEPMFQAAVQEKLRETLLAWFHKTPAGVFPLRQPAESVAAAWSWAIFGMASQWSRGARTVHAAEMADQLVKVLTQPI